jgi:hypothetical protein
LNTLTRAGEDLVGRTRYWSWSWSRLRTRRAGGLRRHPLQSANGLLEGQSLRPQQMRGGALPVADDGGQDDSPVDLTAPPLSRGRRRSLQNALQIMGDENLVRSAWRPPVLDLADMAGDFRGQARQIDVAGPQDHGSVGIFRQGEQQMLQRHIWMGLGVGVTRGARKGRSQMLRHGYAPQIIDHHSPEPAPRHHKSCQNGLFAVPHPRLFVFG